MVLKPINGVVLHKSNLVFWIFLALWNNVTFYHFGKGSKPDTATATDLILTMCSGGTIIQIPFQVTVHSF